MSTNTLFQQIIKLDARDWNDLKLKVAAFLSLTPASVKRQATVDVQTGGDLLTGIIGELRRRKLINSTNANAFVRICGEASIAKVDAAWAQVLGLISRELTPLEKMRLAQLAAEELARYLSKQTNKHNDLIPLGIKRMVYNADKTVEALDAAFPGYISTGLLSFILRTKNGRRR